MPLRICDARSATAPGLLGTNTVVALPVTPISLIASKYCVRSIRVSTSRLPTSLTSFWKLCTLSFRPAMMACLCLAIPYNGAFRVLSVIGDWCAVTNRERRRRGRRRRGRGRGQRRRRWSSDGDRWCPVTMTKHPGIAVQYGDAHSLNRSLIHSLIHSLVRLIHHPIITARTCPARYLASASASAALTTRIFSPSECSYAASRSRCAALISFIAAFTLAAGSMSVINV
mmetsp:Transcript_11686/g.32983  ORF Transcript_11686/g.32983 Transcript_11686/m.32983 type:complete len:228 (+) Transcript_11686:1240-1923(+)